MQHYSYKTQELLEQKVDFSIMFPDKQKVVKEMTGFDFSLPEIVSFLRTSTDNFTKENPIALDVDREIYATYLTWKEKQGVPREPSPTPMPEPSPEASPEEKMVKLKGRLALLERMAKKAEGDKKSAIEGRISILSRMIKKMESKAEPKAEPKVEPKAEPKAEPKSEPKAEPKGGLSAEQIETYKRTIKANKSATGVKIAKRKLEEAGITIE
jgi:hypothetical protein